MRGAAYEVRGCTHEQIREARIAAAKAKGQESKPAPVLQDAWEKGAAMLRGEAGHCYTVEMGRRTFDFVVSRPGERTVLNPDGLTVRYNVCLDPSDTAYGCDCPDNNRRGHERPCKHMLCVRVWAWELAQESEGDFTDWLEHIGALELRRAHEARKGEQG